MAFGPLAIAYDDGVLVPRPWTEAQSRWAAELDPVLPPGPMLELCGGVGQIGLLAAVLTGRSLVTVDRNPTACALARTNADANGLGDRVEVRSGDMGTVLDPGERFPLILADPPYVPTDQTSAFPDDPLLAIDGGADGLALVLTCLELGAAHLAVGGATILQVRGDDQARAVTRLLAGPGAPALEVSDVRGFGPDRALVLLEGPTGSGADRR